MDELAPSVVAVVVAHDPGAWFDETLRSLAAQDYAELAVLVLDAASAEELTLRVAAVLPTAYVRRLEENRGFGATATEARSMVEGADYLLFCHDDVALDPDAVHLMVEEAFRSNAGIVSSKVVSWDDPRRLVHVGMMVDKGGSVVDRVHPHEIDHGQHDAVRDVFVAPGGVTLVRADLFTELGGFDPAIAAMGEDLDLCWRAQVAGARVIVAPDARVRHLEELASGARPVEPSLVTPDGGGTAPQQPTLQELQRRHELLAVFKCYGLFHLVRVVPQLVVLAVGEVIVAGLAGNRSRSRAVVRAWRWNLGRISAIRRQRADLKAHRRLRDKEIRQLQLGGSARLSSYGRRLFLHGFHGAHVDELEAAAESAPPSELPAGTGSPVAAGDRPPVVAGTGTALGGVAWTGSTARLSAWIVAIIVVLIGTRGVLAGRLPVVGQFVPFPGWSETFAAFGTGWHPAGVGTTSPSTPALALVGLTGTVLIGAMGLAQKVLVLACLPVGVVGVARLVRPFPSRRGPVVAGLSYLAMALPYDALSQGRWDGLVLYAGAPWVLLHLFRATGVVPYGPPPEGAGPHPEGAGDGSSPGWWVRRSLVRRVVLLGLVEAVLVSFVPAAAIVVLVAAAALVLSTTVAGEWRAMVRALAVAVAATLVAAFICLPWVVGVIGSGHEVAVFGVPVPASGAPSWGSLLRFAVGPIGGSPLAWGFVGAGLAALVLGRSRRFEWACRLWAIALVFCLAAWIVGRGWTGSLAVGTLVLLAPAAAAVACAIGVGMAAFERDLPSAQFGWRQVVAVLAALFAVLGALPTVVSALPGRWDLPVNDFSQSVSWMRARESSGAFRVLWLGDARALNQGSWSAGGGLAYATSEDGGPDARWLWTPPSAGAASTLASDVALAESGQTDRLGHLLGSAGIRYIVLVTALAPEIAGEQSPTSYPVPSGLTPALDRQLDLSPVVSGTGITVYANADWLAQQAEVPSGRPVPMGSRAPQGPPGTSPVPFARPVLSGPPAARSYVGPVSRGTVLAALAPAGSWSVTQSGGSEAARSPSFDWGARYRVTRAGPAVLGFDGGLLAPLSLLASVLTWIAVLVVLLGWWPGIGRARWRPGRSGDRGTKAARRSGER